MNSAEVTRFVRQVGFGLAPDEDPPADPLAWAQGQLDAPAPVTFLAGRNGGLLQGLPAGLTLLQSQDEVMQALQAHLVAQRQSYESSRSLARGAWEKLHYETVDYPYWRMEPWKEVLARGAMAVNGTSPVFERFWHFWTNHFTVSPAVNNINTAVGPYMRMLRQRMAGSFRDMLLAALTHPAMLLYLDNAKSTGPHSRASRERWTKDQINENLGREMLELFSLSPAAGYTQDDVLAATHVLTGWGVNRADSSRKAGVPLGTYFDYNRHEPGGHTVMGRRYRALVRNDAKLHDLVDDLAAHPATASHLCHKLARAFVTDEPSGQLVERLVQVFRLTRGDLPSLHKAVVAEVALAGTSARKFSLPETWLWTVFRVGGAQLPVTLPRREERGERLHDVLAELGQPIHHCPQPNGWSLHSRDWISREMLDRRVRYAYQFAARLPHSEALLQAIVRRQHGQDSAVAVSLTHAARAGNGHSSRSLWAAYLTSPELLWS